MTGVVLEGGGAKGSYQAGALLALRRLGIKSECFVGTSIGSINAAFAASEDYNKLYSLWSNANVQDLFGINEKIVEALKNKTFSKEVINISLKTITSLIKNAGIDTSKFKVLLEKEINEKKLRESNIDFGLVTYDFTDKKPIEIFKENIPKGKIVEYLIASSYLPVFKTEKIIDNKVYIDGGFYNNCPINMLTQKGYDKIYVIRTFGIGITKKVKIDNQTLITISPKKNLGSTLMFEKDNIKRNMKLGYYDTFKVVKKLDGNNYYFRKKRKEYYNEILKNLTPSQIKLLKFEFKTLDNKKLVIKLVEKLAKEHYIDPFKVYNIGLVILRLKASMSRSHKYYKIVNNLKVKIW